MKQEDVPDFIDSIELGSQGISVGLGPKQQLWHSWHAKDDPDLHVRIARVSRCFTYHDDPFLRDRTIVGLTGIIVSAVELGTFLNRFDPDGGAKLELDRVVRLLSKLATP